MALIRHLTPKHMDRNSLHDEVEATYTVFVRDGLVLLQIDTYGRGSKHVEISDSSA